MPAITSTQHISNSVKPLVESSRRMARPLALPRKPGLVAWF
jgi:hypothetical protein